MVTHTNIHTVANIRSVSQLEFGDINRAACTVPYQRGGDACGPRGAASPPERGDGRARGSFRATLAMLYLTVLSLLLLYLLPTPAAAQQQDVLVDWCEVDPDATMCESSGACTDSMRESGSRYDAGGRWWSDGGGACWREASGPCSDAWQGVFCDVGGTVAALHLGSSGISVIPPEIGLLVNLKVLSLSNNSITVIPPEIEFLVNLNTLILDDNSITVIPPEIGLLVNLHFLTLGDNRITVIPPEIGLLVNLVGLRLECNNITVVSPEIGRMVSLETLTLYSNPLEVGQSFRAPQLLYHCPIAAEGDAPRTFVLRGDMCEMCDITQHAAMSFGGNHFHRCTRFGGPDATAQSFIESDRPGLNAAILNEPSFYTALIFIPLALLMLYRFASSTWRPSNRVGVECVVCSRGLLGGKGAEVASKTWAKRLAAHLDVSEAEIRVDHAGTTFQAGDDVSIDGLTEKVCVHCKTIDLSSFNGLVGTVMVTQQDGDTTARVGVHGRSGIWNLPMQSLTLQPLFVDVQKDAPAVCVCITNEWAASLDFVASVLHILAMKNGVEDLVCDDHITDREATAYVQIPSGLTKGAIFILCGDNVESQAGFQTLKERVSLATEQIIHADSAGVSSDDADHVTQALNELEHFLSTHRHSDEHLENQLMLQDAIDDHALVQGVMSDRKVHYVATHVAAVVRIVVLQLQQCFSFLSWRWSWPKLLIQLRRWVGSWVLFDFPTFMNTDCLVGGGNNFLSFGYYVYFALLLVMFCIGFVTCVKRRQWKQAGNEAAAAASAHLENFGWALFTLGSPMVVSNIVALVKGSGISSADYSHVLLAYKILFPYWLVVPLLALCQLHQARAAGVLHSRAFEARYGWLCSRYRAESICYAWELLVLEVRFLIIIIGGLIMDPIISALAAIVITLCLLIMHVWFKPYKETAKEAAHWSSSNRMGTVSYCTQLVVLAVGFLCNMMGDSLSNSLNVMLSLVAVVALSIPLALTGKIVAINKEMYESVVTDTVSNVFHVEGSFEIESGSTIA